MDKDCPKECKLCPVYKYGVFLLNIGAIFVVLCTLVIYWKEILSCFRVSNKEASNITPTPENDMSGDPNMVNSPTADETLMNNDNIKRANPGGTSVIMNQQPNIIPMLTLTDPVQPQLLTAIPSPQILQPSPQILQPPPLLLQPVPSQIHLKRDRRKTSSPNPQTHKAGKQLPPTTKGPAKNVASNNSDPFKLPTPDEDGALKRQESTGSNYFKQMMKGKKIATSISEYALLRNNNKGKKGKGKKFWLDDEEIKNKRARHHHHKRHRDK